jgi:hypothetical protein
MVPKWDTRSYNLDSYFMLLLKRVLIYASRSVTFASSYLTDGNDMIALPPVSDFLPRLHKSPPDVRRNI